MAAYRGMPAKKTTQKAKIWTRMFIPLLLVVLLQIATYSAVLIFGGEFRNIREYAYSTLVEKTENRGNYLRNELRSRPLLVQEYAEQINELVAEILEENGATVADLQADKELNSRVMEAAVNTVVGLLRSSLSNDVYFILDTGDLYADEGDPDAKAALYLRDLDPNSGSGYTDLLMEIGSTSISQQYGITRHAGWSLYFTPRVQDSKNFDFYYRPLQAAQNSGALSVSALGYWSEFSSLSSSIIPSMKYSLPLIAQDGTAYGVLGIGWMESTLLSSMPANDFMSESACYVLGHSVQEGSYRILTHSGTAYADLLGTASTVYLGEPLKENEALYALDMASNAELLGSVQILGLYGPDSAYEGEHWALISVADKASVLQPVTYLSQMLVVSALASLIVAALVAVPSFSGVVRPITSAIRLMKAKQNFNEVIHFQPSNIYEIDEMTDAITQLQINVQSVSSEVSKMISIADVGLGSFRYDRPSDSVFVGQSLIKMLDLTLPQDEDVMVSLQQFLDSIHNKDVWSAICAGLGMVGAAPRHDYSHVYPIHMPDASIRWLRMGYTYSPTSAICIVQDITDTTLEKQRIEFERDYDTLTGLMNRHAYYRHIEELFSDKDSLKVTAFVMIDLDNLKFVNDNYGHDFGDDYIRTAAVALKQFEEYGGIVARISGDEFNICLPGFATKEAVREIITKVRAGLLESSCLLADGSHLKVRCSMGVSWYPDDADTPQQLMKYADFAMYTIKHGTKGAVAEFDSNAYSTDSAQLAGVEEMKRILEEGRIKYAFQSIVSAKTGEIYGYEALMRVKSEILQSPLELLRTAQANNKLYDIERLTWSRSLADYQHLLDAGLVEPTAHIFVNSIATCALNSDDSSAVEASFGHLLPRVVLELLENESANETLTAEKKAVMKRYGGQIALDDFGTGYNSEYALLSIQPNIIKIDRSIVSGCDRDPSRRMIINSLVQLARTKQILVLVEGVETEGELKTVIDCGVDLLQGYYLAKPVFEPQPLAPALVQAICQMAAHKEEPVDENAILL